MKGNITKKNMREYIRYWKGINIGYIDTGMNTLTKALSFHDFQVRRIQ
jgi:hypothetical protein